MINPYLSFKGNTREVLSFYSEVFNTKDPEIMNYGDYVPEGSTIPADELRDWVMHAQLEICGTTVLFADEVAPLSFGNNISLTVTYPSKEEGERVFLALSERGEVLLPPLETFYSPFHAAVKDRYGVHWHVIVGGEQA